MSHLCGGFPPGHECPVIVPDTVELCRGCKVRSDHFEAAGVPSGMVPVGIVLEDFNAPKPVCSCGGDPSDPDHKHSLLHAEWAWKQGKADRRDTMPGAQFPHYTVR